MKHLRLVYATMLGNGFSVWQTIGRTMFFLKLNNQLKFIRLTVISSPIAHRMIMSLMYHIHIRIMNHTDPIEVL